MKKRNENTGGYVSNFTNYDDIKSDSAQSMPHPRTHKTVADVNLRRLLADPMISETEQIEKKAKMEEQRLRLLGPHGNGGNYYNTID